MFLGMSILGLSCSGCVTKRLRHTVIGRNLGRSENGLRLSQSRKLSTNMVSDLMRTGGKTNTSLHKKA